MTFSQIRRYNVITPCLIPYIVFHWRPVTIPMLCLVTKQRRFIIARTQLCCAVSASLMMMVTLFVCSGVGSSGSSHWELMGDAMVTTEQVRLTPDMQSRQGAVWSRIVSVYCTSVQHHEHKWSLFRDATIPNQFPTIMLFAAFVDLRSLFKSVLSSICVSRYLDFSLTLALTCTCHSDT